MSRPKSKSISSLLKSIRKIRGLSQGDLASITGLKPAAVSHFETGQRSPSLNNLKRLADALEVSADYLLGRIDEPQARGSLFDKLLNSAQRLTKSDLETLTNFAEMLAKQNQKKTPKKRG